LLDLNREHESISYGDVDCVSTYLSRDALARFREEHDLPQHMPLRAPGGVAFNDEIIRNLGESLLPALERPETANRLFVDHVAFALLSHLTATYVEEKLVLAQTRGALAPWQERRAKEMLVANLDGAVGLDELAAECRLSRSHFARAFKTSTGTSPLRWLAAQKIERTKDLLLNTDLPLGRIAELCGFSDASHLSRVFQSATGCPPGAWRRLHRTALDSALSYNPQHSEPWRRADPPS
jgi:AraC-like DNA-binding protein